MAREPLPTLPDAPRADVLVATVDAPLRDQVAMRLWADGCRVVEIDDESGLFDALSDANHKQPDLVVADVRFTGPGVWQMLWELRRTGTPIMFVGGEREEESEADEVCREAERLLAH